MARQGKLTVSEAGKKGGTATAGKYGHAFYQEIGHKGGKKGGDTVKAKYGHDFYVDIGKKGGHKVRDLIKKGQMAA
jgi:uncharacterized protein